MLFITINCFFLIRSGRRKLYPLIFLEEQISKTKVPVLFWENSIGRDKTCDIIIPDLSVSRNHAVLKRREEGWFICDTDSKSGVLLNGKKVKREEVVAVGDILSFGQASFALIKNEENLNKKRSFASSPFGLLLSCNIMFLLMAIDCAYKNTNPNYIPFISFGCLFALSFLLYFYSIKILKRVNFEIETLAVALSGSGIMLLSGINLRLPLVQIAALFLGMFLFCFMMKLISNADVMGSLRIVFEIIAICLFLLTVIFGTVVNGAQNWIYIGSYSIQPSEFIKIAFVFAGASTLHQLQKHTNLLEFIIFSLICTAFLIYMHDFGSAIIFFFAFLIISFMRSGSIRTVFLALSASLLGVFIVLRFKPYIADRFAGWGKVWEHPYDLGYQQTRVLTYSADGGLLGLGIGKGYLKNVFAGESDLIFGMLCEELGIIFALTVAFAFVILCYCALSNASISRSAFYSISSCAAAGLLLFQAAINIFGVTDIMPLTGVTLPFISAGGSSMVAVWGLLAFIKACDEKTWGVRRGK